MFDNISHNLGIDTLIAMHDDVAEADHLAHGIRQVGRQPVMPMQQVKQLPVGAWLAQTPIRHNMGRNV